MNWMNTIHVARALGAMEPGDQAAMNERMEADAQCAFNQAGWNVLVGARDNPLDKQQVHLRGTARGAHILGEAVPIRVGNLVEFRFQTSFPAQATRCVLVREVNGSRTLVHPSGFDWPPLTRFRSEADVRLLDLVVDAPPGHHRYTLVLVPASVYQEAWDAEDERWTRVLEAFEQGRLPGKCFDLDVQPTEHTVNAAAS